MLAEQASELSLPQPEAVGQRADVALIQGAELDQGQRSGHRARCSPPSAHIRCGLRPAPQAGAESSLLGRRRRRIERYVLRPRRPCRTDRATVDSRRLDGGEKTAIEARIAQLDRAVAGVVIKIHGEILAPGPGAVQRFSDIIRAVTPWCVRPSILFSLSRCFRSRAPPLPQRQNLTPSHPYHGHPLQQCSNTDVSWS